MPAASPIVVIGSANMDLVCRVHRMPLPGQTMLGSDFVTIPGGKGANQAVAAAKLARAGSEVALIGRVGGDDFGQRLLNGLAQHHVNTLHVTVTEGASSGAAMILVDEQGENSIVVVPGANARLKPRDIDAADALIKSAAVVLMQLEIPHETVVHAIAVCQRHGVHTILDPAPASDALTRAMFGVDVLVPNQSEAETLLGHEPSNKVKRKGVVDPKQIATELLAKGPGAVVLKLGARGAMLLRRSGQIDQFTPHKVNVMDTTAAGDAFAAALAVGHLEGMDLASAVRLANAAGALTCQHFGAQPSLPARSAVDKLLAVTG
jgi:ribokinase